MEYILIWSVLGIIAAFIAQSKGKSFAAWFVLGVLFGPLAIIIVALSSGTQCPYCKKGIDAKAIVCPYCQRDLKTDEIKDSMSTEEKVNTITKQPLDRFKKIRLLADLRDKKQITNDEFEEYKSKL